nr:RNA-directed DNA polymerase, eukaryota [Tanacetum cinerariifolium]
VIKGIHGKDGKLDDKAKYSHPSIWLDIVREIKHLKDKDIDLLRYIWSLEGNGDVSVASTLSRIDDSWLQDSSFKTRWVKAVQIKVKILAWKVSLDCLPPRLNISKRGMDITSISCPICGLTVESVSHTFFACKIAREIFQKVCNWWDITFTELVSHEHWLAWLSNIRLHSKYKTMIEGVCYTIVVGYLKFPQQEHLWFIYSFEGFPL